MSELVQDRGRELANDDRKYPFVTKAAILARLNAAEPTFVVECMHVMQARYEARVVGNAEHGGWMASHSVIASTLAKRVAAPDATGAEIARAAAILRRYSKQLASHLREQALREDPSLAEAAARYGVGAPAAPAPRADGSYESELERCDPALRPNCDRETADLLGTDGVAAAAGSEPEGAGHAQDAGVQAEQGDATASAVLALLPPGVGLRSEELASRLCMTTAALGPSLRSLVDNGVLRREGQARGTRYYIR